MNLATVHGRRSSKRPPLSDSPAIVSLQLEAKKKIFFSDNLRRRWEQIISGDRS